MFSDATRGLTLQELYLHSAQPNDPASFDESFMTNNPAQEDYDRPDLASQLFVPLLNYN